MKDLSKTCVSSNNRLKLWDKKIKNSILGKENERKETQDPKAKTVHGNCRQDEIIWSKIEKSIQIKTVGILQDSN